MSLFAPLTVRFPQVIVTACAVLASIASLPQVGRGQIPFRTQELASDLGVGYAVRLLDLNEDGHRDIVVVDKTRVLWLANPDWQRHTLLEGKTQADNVCFAPRDIDGDGDLDLALGAGWAGDNGTIQWLEQPEDPAREWSVHPIGSEPYVHRMRWADLQGDGRAELIVLPLVGRGGSFRDPDAAPIRVLSLTIPKNPKSDPWPVEVLSEQLHVAHNFWPTELEGDGRSELLLVSYEGVTLLKRNSDGGYEHRLLGRGHQDETSARRGASEIRTGLLADKRPYLATIEPWHGHQVVVYTPPAAPSNSLWHRQVLDEDLRWGHAVACANLDDDEEQELVIGVRDNQQGGLPSGVRVYDPDGKGNWRRQLVDPGGVAVEDMAVADLNGDHRPDIVAVGRATKNVRIYWNESGR